MTQAQTAIISECNEMQADKEQNIANEDKPQISGFLPADL